MLVRSKAVRVPTVRSDVVALFCVERQEEAWIVSRNGRKLRLRLSLDVAVTDAIKAAIESHRKGLPTQVLFNSGREIAPLWCNGNLISAEAVPIDAELVGLERWAA